MRVGDWISLAGLVVSVIGFSVAIRELIRIAKASEAGGRAIKPAESTSDIDSYSASVSVLWLVAVLVQFGGTTCCGGYHLCRIVGSAMHDVARQFADGLAAKGR